MEKYQALLKGEEGANFKYTHKALLLSRYKDDWLDYQKRYNTEEEAISGHIQAIAYVDQLHQEESVKV